MSQITTIAVVEQKTILFYDDELTAVRAEDGEIYVAIRQMCRALGLDQRSQRRRIQQHTILNRGYTGGVISTPPGAKGGGGEQRVTLLRVDLVPMWLAGIRTASVKPELKEKLETYQEKAARVLWEAFQEGRLSADSAFDDLLQTDSDAVQAYKMALAIMKLARNQVLLEARLDTQEKSLTEFSQRLEQVEATLGHEERHITPDQASQLSQSVKAVAIALGKKSKRNEFGACYGELYRRYGITSYKALPTHKFDDAMKFLTEWHQSIVTDTPF